MNGGNSEAAPEVASTVTALRSLTPPSARARHKAQRRRYLAKTLSILSLRNRSYLPRHSP